MNEKIKPQALEKLAGRHQDEPVSLSLRITTPLSHEQIGLLTAWGGTLRFDSAGPAAGSVRLVIKGLGGTVKFSWRLESN